ncbi:MAG: N-acetylmuramoyl-L-alanine amidase [Clostridiales bacterium]|nr:N-acetylmuramoyl-L-alanine amidase [Clostridiales bacterium]
MEKDTPLVDAFEAQSAAADRIVGPRRNVRPLPDPNKAGKERTSTHEGAEKKKSSKCHRFAVLLLVAVLVMGGLTGCMILLDRQGDLASFRSFFSSSDSSSKKKKNHKSKKNADKNYSGEEYGDYEEDGSGRSAGYLLEEGYGSGDLTGYTVILDPGHGGRDTGCVFPFDAPDYYECEFNLRIADAIKDDLVARGANVYMLRTDNSWISLYNRLAQTHLICLDIAEKQGKLPFSKDRADELRWLLQQCIDINEDTVASGGMGIMVGSGVGEDLEDLFDMEYELDNVIFLAVHLNSSESRQQHGTQIYYVTDDSVIESEHRQMETNSEFQRSDFPIREDYYGRKNDDNELLAWCLYDNIVGNIPEFETNGYPTSADNYAVLREHGLCGALIEVAFLSDDNDRNMLLQDSNVKSVATSVTDGVVVYFREK